MDSLERLTALFTRFPGIGPRQAGRFVQFLLRSSPSIRHELVEAIQDMSSGVYQCTYCMRYHSGNRDMCSICSNPQRDTSILAVIATDTDLIALERSQTFRGQYFVIGGTISLASEKMHGLRVPQLLATIQSRIEKGLTEVILAFPANPEGDATATHLREELLPLTLVHTLTVSTLGRGLSTGSELEYADPETLRNALDNRR